MSVLKPLYVIKQITNASHNATVIFLHGSGDTGEGMYEWVQAFPTIDFRLPNVKFLFPTAPMKSYTFAGGEMRNVWFDRTDIHPDVPEHNESILPMQKLIKELVDSEIALGIPLNRIIIGGFSMGGAMALYMGYRFLPGLAGVFAVSSFMNEGSELFQNSVSHNTPLLMIHGNQDELVPRKWGENTFNRLKSLGIQGHFVPVNRMEHEITPHALTQILNWTKNILPDTK